MAYPDNRRLIQRTKQAAKALGVASTWVNSRRHINMKNDFVFELYSLFEFIGDLLANYRISYNPGVGNKRNNFPKKPAKKEGRPKFEIYSKRNFELLWQVCSGTKIKDIVNKERAPDISLQNGDSPDDPTHDDVEMIWDAKYRSDDSNRITHPELSDFARKIDLLEVKNATKPKLQLVKLQNLVANCLITNGRESTEPNAERIRLDLKEIANFFPGKSFRVFP